MHYNVFVRFVFECEHESYRFEFVKSVTDLFQNPLSAVVSSSSLNTCFCIAINFLPLLDSLANIIEKKSVL